MADTVFVNDPCVDRHRRQNVEREVSLRQQDTRPAGAVHSNSLSECGKGR